MGNWCLLTFESSFFPDGCKKHSDKKLKKQPKKTQNVPREVVWVCVCACVPVLDPGLLHAVLQIRGLVAKEHVTGAGGGVAGCMKLPFDITHCIRNTHLLLIRTYHWAYLVDECMSPTDPTPHAGAAAGFLSVMSGWECLTCERSSGPSQPIGSSQTWGLPDPGQKVNSFNHRKKNSTDT